MTGSRSVGVRAVVHLVLVAALVWPATASGAGEVAPDARTAHRDIVFPIIGPTTYRGTFGACRDRCRRSHEGTDVFAPRMAHLVATRDATVIDVVRDPRQGGIYGNNVTIEDDDGWTYRYVHLNNDTPGTDDGRNPPEWITGPGIEVGARVVAGQLIGYVGDSGNSEGTLAHLHFEIHRPGDLIIDPYPSLVAAPTLLGAIDPDASEPQRVLAQRIASVARDEALGDVAIARAVDGMVHGRPDAGVETILEHPTWRARTMAGWYERVLHRQPDRAGLTHWSSVATVSGEQAAVAGLLVSDEYIGGRDADAWLGSMYQDLFGRGIDDGGTAHWRARLAHGATTRDVAVALWRSPEGHRGRLDLVYRLVLDRSPDESGREHWSAVLDRSGSDRVAAGLFLSDEFAAPSGG